MKKNAFLITVLLLLVAGNWSACKSKTSEDKLEPEDCPSSPHFIRYVADGLLYAGHLHFSTPDGRWFRIFKDQLIRVTPQNEQEEVYQADGDIIYESLRIAPDGGIFFSGGGKVYYLSPGGILSSMYDDTNSGMFSSPQGVWSGAAFITEDGYYGYADRDGEHVRVAVLDVTGHSVLHQEWMLYVPQGNCLAAYYADDKYTFILQYVSQGTLFVKRYRFYEQAGGGIMLSTADYEVPAEVTDRDWLNYRPEGNGYFTFDIYDEEVVHHYRINDNNGSCTKLPDTPRRLEGPDCYYSFVAETTTDQAYVLYVTKHQSNGTLVWEREIPTGGYLLSETYGWANAQGVYLVSGYYPMGSSVKGSCQIYISADGVICD